MSNNFLFLVINVIGAFKIGSLKRNYSILLKI